MHERFLFFYTYLEDDVCFERTTGLSYENRPSTNECLHRSYIRTWADEFKHRQNTFQSRPLREWKTSTRCRIYCRSNARVMPSYISVRVDYVQKWNSIYRAKNEKTADNVNTQFWFDVPSIKFKRFPNVAWVTDVSCFFLYTSSSTLHCANFFKWTIYNEVEPVFNDR